MTCKLLDVQTLLCLKVTTRIWGSFGHWNVEECDAVLW
jgi:hypothetical protein